MIIENKEYIKLKIKEKLFYYFISDVDLDKKRILDLKDRVVLINDIYLDFIKYMSDEYKVKKIIDINKFKEENIYYEIEENNILFNLIEGRIY